MSTDSTRDDGQRAIGSEPVRVASAAPNPDLGPVLPVAPVLVLDATSGGQIVIPGGTFLLYADYVREGADLLLIGADGQRILIRGFFAGEFPPDLVSDTGLRIDADLATRLAGPIAPGEFAQAQDAPEAQPIGRVETLQGTVTAARVDGTTVTLEVGAAIFEGDVLETAGGAAVGVVFLDDSTFSLDEDARMVIDELVYDPSSEEGTSALSVVQGVFSFVSGKIAGAGPDNMVITTPVATIGVRGTAGAGVAAPEGQLNTVTLLSEEGGIVGEISITNSTGTVVLNVANASVSVESFFTAPGEQVILTNDQIGQLFGNAISNLPPPPGGGGVDVGAVDPGQGTGNQPPADGDGDGGGEADGDGDGDGDDGAPGDGDGGGDGEGGDADGPGDGDGDGEGQPGDGEGQQQADADGPGQDGAGDGGDGPGGDGGDGPGGDGGGDFFGGDGGGDFFDDGGGDGPDILLGGFVDGGGGFDFLDFGGDGGVDFVGPGDGPDGEPDDFFETPPPIDLPVIDVFDASASETDGTISFTVFRSGNLNLTTTVDLATGENSALAGIDYVDFSGSVFFDNGVSSQTVTISLIDDTDVEDDEDFFLDIIDFFNAELGTGTATGTISSEDVAEEGGGGSSTLSIGSASGSENPGNAVFTVTRSGDTSGTTTVQFTTVDNTADAGLDFSPTSGTLTFAPGVTTQFITVPVLADKLFEPTERFQVTLSNPSTGATITDAIGEGTIADNPKSFVAGQFLSDLADGTNGFVLNGIEAQDSSGGAVSAAGDINGDGIGDFIIGAPGGDPVAAQEGETYVVFGGASNLAALDAADGTSDGSINLSSLDGTTGFRLDGVSSSDLSGGAVGAADINGDGRSDLIIGARNGDAVGDDEGETYVVFGQTSFAAVFDLSNGGSGLDGTNGFKINGVSANDYSGEDVAAAGDVNNDGIQDLIIGAPGSDVNPSDVGNAYVVFGATNVGSTGTLNLSDLNGANGFRMTGIDGSDKSGYSVAGGGDVNGDGIDDVIVGARYGDGVSGNDNGEAYIIFGATNVGGGGTLSFGTDGFVINGIDTYDYAGFSVDIAGDVNNDGIDDLLIGARRGDPNGATNAGESYVVFGNTSLSPGGSFNLSALDGSNGFVINGIDGADEMGTAVAGAGDVNGDGIDDILISAPRAQVNDNSTVGEAYVVFGATDVGSTGSINLSSLGPTAGTRFDGTDTADRLGDAVGAGDVNGDGFSDVLLAAYQGDPNGAASGETFLIFGGTTFGGSTRPTLDLRSLDGDIGFTLNGIAASDSAGRGVSNAGDINNDGFEDFLIGAPRANGANGEAYLVFGGSAVGAGGTFNLSALNGSNGFLLQGPDGNAGYSVSAAGDVNGDGIADLIVGAHDYAPGGRSYVVLGGISNLNALDAADNGGVDGTIELAQLTLTSGSHGFEIRGIDSGDSSGKSLRSADVNADGFDDLIIGAPFADPPSGTSTGETYIVFGGSTVGAGDGIVSLSSDLGGTGGFVLYGIDGNDRSGRAVNDAGDVNGDGIADLIIGAYQANGFEGEAYVVFGGTGNLQNLDAADTLGTGIIDLEQLAILDGSRGYVFLGDSTAGDSEDAGYSVAGAGDFNGDGINDIIIGAPYGHPTVDNDEGRAYIVFGGSSNLAALDALDGSTDGTIDLSRLDGTNGFDINGNVADRHIGGTVSGIGDFNGDGFGDVLLSSYTEGNAYAGGAFVVFGGANVGSSGNFNLSSLSSGAGFEIPEKLEGEAMGEFSRGAGDVNGDGFDDIIIGAYDADPNGISNAGESYVIFGGDFSQALTQQGTIGNDTLTGTGAADVFVGGIGNDVLLGNGGVDVLRGGAGDDILSVSNSAFRSLDGGTHTSATGGGDVLAFDSGGTTLDLTAVADSKIESIEILDIGGTGGNTLVLQLTDVLNLSEATNEIKIFGDADDFVSTSGEAWSGGGNVVVDGETFKKFTLGGGTLLVDSVIDTTQITLV